MRAIADIGAAVIGTGFIGTVHVEALRRIGVQVCGVLGSQDQEFLRKFTARTPLGRLAEGTDLLGPLLFLASDESRYVTGQELRVDGGFTA